MPALRQAAWVDGSRPDAALITRPATMMRWEKDFRWVRQGLSRMSIGGPIRVKRGRADDHGGGGRVPDAKWLWRSRPSRRSAQYLQEIVQVSSQRAGIA